MRPCCNTKILSAACTVVNLCAMTNVVIIFARNTLSNTSITTRSLSASKALVASSSNSTLGLRISARAIAMRCFWPPLNRAPRSPTSVM
mmetsp:Transcript_115707/g.367943  ORF Transcript_115707/g.367943 Transcript_115707/m.367943 type:complete len:89 (-) Transcript_115707:1658-1924(-)